MTMAVLNASEIKPLMGSGQASELVKAIIGTERYIEMDRRQAYLTSTMHDTKEYDFEGRRIPPGPIYYGGSTNHGVKMPGISIPLRGRRPCMPARLGRTIIGAFTDLVFGEDRFPELIVPGDEDGSDFIRECAKAAALPSKMIRARNLGGAMGSVGLSWAIVAGLPVVRVHNTKGIRVTEWKDRDSLVPNVVEEIRLFSVDEPDIAQNGRIVRKYYWWRRTWTPNEDIVYKPIAAKDENAPGWTVDLEKTAKHNDNRCHFEWIQNTPSEQEDGESDIEGLWEQLDEVDAISSVVSHGAKRNLDPTLKLKMDAAQVQMVGVKKGSDQAIVTGTDGDASYLELSGSSITAGLSLYEAQRKMILEAAQCVLPDPDVVAASGTSSVAIKAIYAKSLSRGGILREQYGQGMKRVLDGIREVSRKRLATPVAVIDKETGQRKDAKFVMRLPPKIEEKETTDPETGLSTKTQEQVARSPGMEGNSVDLSWPAWFPPTPADQQATATTVQIATGGKSFLSQQTGAEFFAKQIGRDPSDEWERLEEQGQSDQEKQAEMFQGSSFGAPPLQPKPNPFGGPPKPNPFQKGPPGGEQAAEE